MNARPVGYDVPLGPYRTEHMPQALLSREDLLDRLLLVFRDRGFEGATIAEIARATGLGKASLYHHFPMI